MEHHVIHKSVPTLLFKGGIAWVLLMLFDYVFDLMLANSPLGATPITFFGLISSQALFHLIINTLFGWLFLYIVLSWFFEYYIIRPDAIIVRKGIVFTHEDIYQMEDVKSIDVYQGFFGRLLHTGTVEFYCFRMRMNIYLSHIPDPYTVAAHIHEMHPTPSTLNWPPRSRIHHRNRVKYYPEEGGDSDF